MFLILLMDGDLESRKLKPKTKTKKEFFFSCCHWNVNSLLAHNKLAMLETYNIAHKYDALFLTQIISRQQKNADAKVA